MFKEKVLRNGKTSKRGMGMGPISKISNRRECLNVINNQNKEEPLRVLLIINFSTY
ncbi:hypothetical protein ERICIV_04610 (plasmid) [Paenibacillus larvae subsp. larvae]|uniref:Uncharacterized protein n=1 Tax=Paenibacillus larvae subsp. larvae TaxID=147375 RepID=A0A2L1UKB5_9BACL|nr:hypothetical protein [Paenibacillus larvae]AVF28992.1 hypothetical protein ERICIII_04991 [Paenibacillus larvae subsp. larvae]AVF33373.1 hypothetical protein ERICIV_04610 [Paenibacillus larvae subsp. larvae]MCY7522027.1 hypothetical protein [Paenibacillus larvae]MCY9500554.1 hypothetical protein [Paenibacillus larvae]MCY9563946.1 hypothetical protein [Paenibacillus larvae]